MMAFIQRTGQDTILRSEKLPAIEIQIDPEFKYAGSTSFILYNIAHVEQHHFVVPDAERRVVRHLWFQFEGYLDNNERKYRYSGMDAMTLKGLTFLHHADVMNIDDDYKERPTSDSAHVVDFLREKGYILEGDKMFKRMVWLDADLRNELMIIYSEDLNPTGFRVSDLAKGGSDADKWSSLSRALHQRALASIAVE
jgi:hypothetical protein